MAKEDETALMLLNTEQKNELTQAKRQLNEMKKGMPGLGTLAVGGVSALTAAAIGAGEGMKTGGDPTAEKAIKHIGGGLALIAGTAGAIAAGPSNPKARTAATGVAIGGATIIAYNLAKEEGIAMSLQAAAEKAKAAAAPQVGAYRR
jgi:hypothetical protein